MFSWFAPFFPAGFCPVGYSCVPYAGKIKRQCSPISGDTVCTAGPCLFQKKTVGTLTHHPCHNFYTTSLLYGSFFRCQLFCMEDVKSSEKIFSGFGNRRKNKKMAGVPNRGNPGVSHYYLPRPYRARNAVSVRPSRRHSAVT